MSPRRTKSSQESGAERPRPEQPLSHERIVHEALALVDNEGLEALSMRRLAATLGVDPMAIYYYLPNKAALKDAIVEAVNTEIEGPIEFHSSGCTTSSSWPAGCSGLPCSAIPMRFS